MKIDPRLYLVALGLVLIGAAVYLNSWIAFALFTVILFGVLFVYGFDRLYPAPRELASAEEILELIDRQQREITNLTTRVSGIGQRPTLGRS